MLCSVSVLQYRTKRREAEGNGVGGFFKPFYICYRIGVGVWGGGLLINIAEIIDV